MKEDKGNISDGYHTFNELYEYRLLYNASMFNELAKQGLYDVHKSRLHSDGEYPFGDSNNFIVMAELPTGQISNHYEMKDWNLFQIPEKEKANVWDGHTSQDVANRLREFLMPKPKFPQTYKDCCEILRCLSDYNLTITSDEDNELFKSFYKMKVCRDAYWQIASKWKANWDDDSAKYVIDVRKNSIVKDTYFMLNTFLAFPTEEMRDAFYENFNELIEECKELL